MSKKKLSTKTGTAGKKVKRTKGRYAPIDPERLREVISNAESIWTPKSRKPRKAYTPRLGSRQNPTVVVAGGTMLTRAGQRPWALCNDGSPFLLDLVNNEWTDLPPVPNTSAAWHQVALEKYIAEEDAKMADTNQQVKL